MRLILIGGVCLAAMCATGQNESWRLPLAEKERTLESNCIERHNILGLYPSQIEVPLDGSPINISTRGYTNIAHSVCWTANYLAGASYRYAFLKKSGAPEPDVAEALARADELFESVYRCQLVTGVKGLQARGYAIGHGEAYEERQDVGTSNDWHQGAGEYNDLRWRGSPSHHNYSDSTHGLMQYYDLAAQGAQKDRARDAIANLVGYWVDNDMKIDHLNPERQTPVLGWTDGKTLNTRIMMAVAQAKYGHYVTGQERFKAMYDKLIDQFSIRGMTEFKTDKDFDDAEHVFCHLENLFRIEKDTELLAAYHIVADALWANHKNDAHSLFSFIYASATPDMPGRDKALKEALYSLQTWPTDMTLRPTMSSLRQDLKPPYPVYAAAWDNEYIWKGNLLNADGWLSRVVIDVAVPAEDPMVIYALDGSGDIYQSRDGAATTGNWFPINQEDNARQVDSGPRLRNGLRAKAQSIDAGPRVRLVTAVCNDGFYVSTTGGYTWRHLPDPDDSNTRLSLRFDAENPKVIYAITGNGAYRSEARRRTKLGDKWETCDRPPASADRISIFKGGDTKAVQDARTQALYKAGDGQGVLKSTDGGKTWTAHTAGLAIPLVTAVIVSPNTDWVFAGTPAGLFVSKDGAETWEDGHLTLQFTKNTRRELGGAAFIDAYWRARYYGFIDEAAAQAPYTADK